MENDNKVAMMSVDIGLFISAVESSVYEELRSALAWEDFILPW